MRIISTPDNLVLRALAKRLPKPRSFRHLKLEAGDCLWTEGEELRSVLFPLDGLVSLRVAAGGSKQVETLLVGREGFAEVNAILGATRLRASAFALTGGEAVTMPVETFRSCLTHRQFRLAAESYARLSLVTLERISVCNRVHGIDALVAGRLLHMQDRTARQSFDITQDALAKQLGVRRASVSRAATQLQKHAAIHYDRRGRLTLVSRDRIESLTCPCYRVLKAEFDTFVQARGGL
jgi:CRP-like cAMP-binding protein